MQLLARLALILHRLCTQADQIAHGLVGFVGDPHLEYRFMDIIDGRGAKEPVGELAELVKISRLVQVGASR